MLATVFLCAVSTAAPVSVAAAGLCADDERTWFSAEVESSDDLVALCGPEAVDGVLAWLQFRQGPPGQAALAWPEKRAGSINAFTIRRYTRPRTTYLKLDFDRGNETYAILEGFEDVGGATMHDVGLRIRRDRDETTDKNFELKPTTEPLVLMRLESFVPSAPFDE
jgi:hypothetical protein